MSSLSLALEPSSSRPSLPPKQELTPQLAPLRYILSSEFKEAFHLFDKGQSFSSAPKSSVAWSITGREDAVGESTEFSEPASVLAEFVRDLRGRSVMASALLHDCARRIEIGVSPAHKRLTCRSLPRCLQMVTGPSLQPSSAR